MRMITVLLFVALALWLVGCSPPTVVNNHPTPVAPAIVNPDTDCPVEGAWAGMIPGGILAGRMVNLTFYQGGMARGNSGSIVLEVTWQEVFAGEQPWG